MSTTNPRWPTLLVRQGTVIISLPSHSPEYAGRFDSLVAAHAELLRTAERLIVDLRGNEGGSSWMTNSLLPYIMTRDLLPERYPDRSGGGVMLSSPDQIAYAKRAFGPDTSQFVRSLVERLSRNPGQFVPLTEQGTPSVPPQNDSIIDGPRRVALMIDGGTVSASEVLVLRALRSRRAIVIGENTEGALDYQSTSIARLLPSPARWWLGYPTITRDTLLPRDGMRGKGIAPQRRVAWDTIPDPITRVDALLRSEP